MNERILSPQLLKLVQAAGPGYSLANPEWVKKFAELFVQECIEQASIGNGHGNNQWDRALTFAAKNIKEHFGVEE